MLTTVLREQTRTCRSPYMLQLEAINAWAVLEAEERKKKREREREGKDKTVGSSIFKDPTKYHRFGRASMVVASGSTNRYYSRQDFALFAEEKLKALSVFDEIVSRGNCRTLDDWLASNSGLGYEQLTTVTGWHS